MTTILKGSGCAIALFATLSCPATAQTTVNVFAESGSPPEGSQRRFFVILSQADTLPVTVDFATSDGTAIAPGDYLSTSGQLTIPAGQTVGQILVTTVDDNISEPPQSIVMNISNPVNAVLGANRSANGFISDNDPLPILSVSGDISLLESGGPAVFTLSLDRLSEFSPTFTAITSHGSAASGDYTPIATSFTIGPSESTKQVPIAIINDSFNEDDESFSITFSTTNANLQPFSTVVRTVAILNDDPLPSIQVLNPLAVTEGANIPLAVQLSPVSGREVQVDYSTADGSAQAPGDYTPISGTFIIPPFTPFATVQVPTIDDEVREGTETFVLQISNPVNAVSGAQSSANAIIHDNDPLPVVSVSTPVGLVAESVTPRIFTASLDRLSDFEVTVQYATEDQSATSPDDYAPVSGTLVFAPGEASKTVEVVVIDDEMDEAAESFRLRISSPNGATLGMDHAVASINDNDPLPVLSVSAPGPSVTESSATIGWTLTLDRPSQRNPRVDFIIAPGTATHPDDFNGPLSGQITFGKGQTSRTISLALVNDDVLEPDEDFEWSLTNAQPLTLNFEGASGTVTILNEDFPDLVLSEATIHPGDDVTPPSISGKLTGGTPNGVAVAEASTDLGIADPWSPLGTVEFDANGEATFNSFPASEDYLGADRLFFRFRRAEPVLD